MTIHKKITVDSNHLYLFPLADFAGGGYLMIDAGPNSDQAFDKLNENLNSANIKLSSLKKIIITHAHSDHMGLANILSKQDIEFYVGAPDMSAYTSGSQFEAIIIRKTAAVLKKNGMPDSILNQWLENKKSRLPLSAIPWANIKPVVGKHAFPLMNNQMLEIVACPGHTPGSIAAYIPQTQEIFSGDTILNNKIPSTGLHYESISTEKQWSGITHFLNTIKQLKLIDIKKVYPAHGSEIINCQAILDYYLEHFMNFEKKILLLLNNNLTNPFEITKKTYKHFLDFPVNNQVQAMIKIICIIEKLNNAKQKN